jgi:hypothetical protein
MTVAWAACRLTGVLGTEEWLGGAEMDGYRGSKIEYW